MCSFTKSSVFKFEPLSIKPTADTDLLKQLQNYDKLHLKLHKSSNRQLPVNAELDCTVTKMCCGKQFST